MPADPPIIVPSSHPFKVEATPSKLGGVNALAKRPLDMTGQGGPLDDHRESVPVDAVPADTWVTLPTDAGSSAGGEGPVLQEQLDTRHREHFDDPSRYLRTDVVVKLPTTAPTPGTHRAMTAGVASDAHRADLTPAASSDPRSARQSSQAARQARPSPSTASRLPPRLRGTPQQRRDAFNERLANIISHQEHLKDELSAVEQAVQSARAKLQLDAEGDEPPPIT